jgi:hypothetical protein
MRLKPPSRRPKYQRLGRKPMTIAAGFRCTNGIVLCSDTEYKHGQSHKSYATKIAHFVKSEQGFSFAMAGAGASTFMTRVFEDFADKLESTIPESVPKATEALEAVLTKLYKKHIFTIPNWRDADADAQFLIAIRTPDGKQDFLETANTMIAKASEHECIGTGADVGEAIIDLAAYPSLTVAEATILAIHTLERVKTTAAFCGGATAVIIQEPSGITRECKFRDISEIEQSLRELQMEITPILLAWSDEGLDEAKFRERVTRATLKVEGLRRRFLRERDSLKLSTKQLIEFLTGRSECES